MLNVINLILGSALLIAGRKLFWLFAGAAGAIIFFVLVILGVLIQGSLLGREQAAAGAP